ncbi:RNA polymerase recycling motor HelD [Cohnella thailandensis]|uniref:UvrD-helicase domain-containing protein n=1 Tax=Cohnella thailandensis TaxID=557557 RepID=A0A841SV71_9BACL|nr:UvrD-helicase domain-containing protein [Cohnella thailandensis]MBP1976561.1 DNA helicase-2/ATP-dependent DNA helicase PcrA [Cohnella thailandensis]
MVEKEEVIRAEETARLSEVLGVIDRRLFKELSVLGDRRGDVVGIRQEFFDDVSFNFSDATELGETWSSIVQQAELLAERERSHRVASTAVERLAWQHDNPYFARIDFVEEGAGNPVESIYIGRSSLIGEDGETFYIYDWRAPVSSLFYDGEPGPVSYETPSGSIRGSMTLKRQFVIRGGQLKHVFDTDETIGDDILQAVLSERSDTSMKSIVATIQKEQNRIIRDEKHKLLVVQGAAGSGKTSAALQRVAYLLYRYRETLTPDQVVLFSPNPVFKGYVSRVLPDLGEANMRQMTFRELIESRLGRRWEVEDLFEQTEELAAASGTAEGDSREAAARYKGSEHFFATVRNYLERLKKQGVRFRPLRFRGDTIVSTEEMSAKYYGDFAQEDFGDRLIKLRKWLNERLNAWIESQIGETWLEEAAELADDEDIQRVYVQIRKQGGFHDEAFDDEDRMTDLLKRRVAENSIAPLRKAVKGFRFMDPMATYRELFRSRTLFTACAPDGKLPPKYEWMAMRADETLGRKTIDYEDATPLLFVMEALEGFRKVEGEVKHLFVDEAQDYSPFQAAFLKRRFPHARLTVLGDFNQAIYAQAEESGGFGGWTRLVPEEETAVWRLTTSYRSTRPIVEFSKRILKPEDAANITPFNRDGEEPSVLSCRDNNELAERVAKRAEELLAAGYATIGIIAKTAVECGDASALIKERLSEETPVTLVTGGSAKLPPGISILPSYLSKGIEFDAVIVWDASAEKYGREQDRKLLYTVCTRALHVLDVYFAGEPSPLLSFERKEAHS